MSEPLAVREAPAAYQAALKLPRVRPGYKQTEVGVIPEDWEVKLLPDICHFRGGKAHEQYISGQGQYVCVNSKFISTEGIVRKYSTHNFCSANQNDILMVMSDLPNGKALAKAYLAEQSNMYAVNQRVCSLTAYRDNPKYLFYVLNRNPYFLKFDNGVSQTHLLNNVFRDCQLPIPPSKAEQEAIAEALSDADALIEALEQLITKKRHLKQGAMQDLLTPKDGWIEKKLGCTATLKARIGWQGLTTAEYLETGDYFLVTGTDFKGGYIDWDHCPCVEESRYKQDKNIQLRLHDVLVTKDGTIGKVALVKQLNKPATLNSGVFVIRPIENAFYPEFFYYLLCSNVFSSFLAQLSAGSTINHLYQKDFVTFNYKTPSSIEEQTAIAAILSDMDAEITALEARLTKTRELKQGMMHNLLTGRIRLI